MFLIEREAFGGMGKRRVQDVYRTQGDEHFDRMFTRKCIDAIALGNGIRSL